MTFFKAKWYELEIFQKAFLFNGILMVKWKAFAIFKCILSTIFTLNFSLYNNSRQFTTTIKCRQVLNLIRLDERCKKKKIKTIFRIRKKLDNKIPSRMYFFEFVCLNNALTWRSPIFSILWRIHYLFKVSAHL